MIATNSFENGDVKIIPACLVYLRLDDKVLMIHRNRNADDYHFGKYNGIGGKFESGESAFEAAKREIYEEAGLDLKTTMLRVLGVLQFPLFKKEKRQDWWVTVLYANLKSAAPDLTCDEIMKKVERASHGCPEGSLEWVPINRLDKLKLWPGDIHFLPYVVKEMPFFGTIWYDGEKLLRHDVRPAT